MDKTFDFDPVGSAPKFPRMIVGRMAASLLGMCCDLHAKHVPNRDISMCGEWRDRNRDGGLARFDLPERARGRRQCLDDLALGGREQRVPEIEDQHDAELIAVVECLVLDRVIED